MLVTLLPFIVIIVLSNNQLFQQWVLTIIPMTTGYYFELATDETCQVALYVTVFCNFAANWAVALVSIDRVVAVVKPFFYRIHGKKQVGIYTVLNSGATTTDYMHSTIR